MSITHSALASPTAAQQQVKPWGDELIFATGEHGFVGKLLRVTAGHSLSLQYHRHKNEAMLVVSGSVLAEIGSTTEDMTSWTLEPGDQVSIPAGMLHRITARTDCVIAEASDAAPGWETDVVRLHDTYGREGTAAP